MRDTACVIPIREFGATLKRFRRSELSGRAASLD